MNRIRPRWQVLDAGGGASNQPFFTHRTSDILNVIDAEYTRLNAETEPNYPFEDRLPIFSQEIEGMDIINAVLKQSPKRAHLDILDVGAGKGKFLREANGQFKKRVTMHGITANDYRTPQNPLKGFDYKIGNAERLLDYYGPNSMDIVFSTITMRHLVDPLGSIAQMYEVAKPNGLVVIDEFELLGLQDKIVPMIDDLRAAGHQIVVDYDYKITDNGVQADRITSMAIRKSPNIPHLQFPNVTYEKLQLHPIFKTEEVVYQYQGVRPNSVIPLPDEVKEYVRLRKELNSSLANQQNYDDGILPDMINNAAWFTGTDEEVAQLIEREENNLLNAARNALNPAERIAKLQEFFLQFPDVVKWMRQFRTDHRFKTNMAQEFNLNF